MFAFRAASSADLPGICALGEEVNLLHHGAFPHIFAGPGPAERDRLHWAQFLDSDGARTFVAEEDGQIVGFVAVAMATETHSFAQPLSYGRVGAVAVTDRRRGHGIGPELMKLAQAWVLNRGGYEVRLNVWAFNEHALHIYRELGYEVRSLNLAKVVAGGA